MNKGCYRVIFNKARGMLMAVAENVSIKHQTAQSPQTTGSTPGIALVIKPLAFSLMLAAGTVTWLPSAMAAGIVADQSAPQNQQPVITSTANGVPLVNIQTPSAAGVSRNTYSQFDVSQQGAILNNSRTNVQTQLGGWIQGNSSLATGTARIILNEVNSSNPSLLNGYVEVGGDRAQVVIANPAGISCDGCGFINASRITLTTGTPIMNGGDLAGYRVGGGNISFLGAGMDSSQANYTDIIARAVSVNAGIWAQNLNITAGSNQVQVDANGNKTGVTPIAGTGSAPTFAVDVAALGGMYAGKISLIGTEAGVGVRNAGTIGASAGEVVVTVDGRLENAGSITSTASTRIDASGSISNSGTVYAQGDASLVTQGNIDNSGVIAALGNTTLAATGASSQVSSTTASVFAAGVQADGTLVGSGNLTLNATQSIHANGQNLAAGDLAMAAGALDLADSQTSAQNLNLNASTGDLDTSRASLSASQTLSAHAAQTMRTDGAHLSADQLALTANSLSNVQGELIQTGNSDLTINLSGDLDNTQGRIAANSANLTLGAQALTNTDGSIEHAGSGALAITATTLTGTRGSLTTNGNLDLTAQTATLDAGSTVARQIRIDTATLSNQGGEIIQTGTGATSIGASTKFDNTGGTLASNGSTTLTVGDLINQGGIIQASGTADLTLTATGKLDNSAAGEIAAGGAVNIGANQLQNATGKITATQSLTATVTQALDNTQGTLAANQDVTVTAASVDNTQGTLGSAQAGVTASTTGGPINNTAGRIESAQDVNLASNGLTNTDGVVSGANINLDSRTQALDNTRGTIAAQGALDIESGQLTNDAGLIQAASSATLNTHGQTLANTNSGATGGIIGQSTVTLATGNLNNQAGFIGAKDNLTASSAAITNTQGGILTSESALALTATSLDNQGGQVQALGDVMVNAGSGAVNNTASLLRSGSTLAITAGSVINANTQSTNQGIEGQSVNIAANLITNATGAIRADDALTLTGHGAVNNTQGLISSNNTLAVADSNLAAKAQAITNTGGTIIANTDLQIDSASLTGDGKVLSQGDLTAKLTSNYTHTGEFQANGTATLETTGTLTNQASLSAGDTLNLTAATINNQANGEITAPNLHLTATDSHTLINRGLIDGQDTFIDTITLNNIGTGRIYGDHVAIGATTLTNDVETVNGVTTAAVIAARDRLDIGAGTITNREHALIFSAGDMAIGGSLDANHEATGQAGTLNNNSATIEALGNLSINAAQINNTNEHFSTQSVVVGTEARDDYQISGSGNIYNSSQVWFSYRNGGILTQLNAPDGSSTNFFHYDYTRTTTETQIASSDPAKLLSGGNMQINAGNVLNDTSQIVAGGALTGIIGTLTNTEVAGNRTITDSGSLYYLWEKHISGDNNNPTITQYWGGYNPAPTVQSLTLTPTVYAQNTAPTGSGTQIAALTTSSVSQTATGASAASVNIGNNQSVNAITQVAAINSSSATGAGTVIRSGGVNTALPNNSLFQTNPNPASSYLIATDPRFANYRTWLSSDYMTQQLSFDPAITQKRLGDGFYEQRLIREQVAELTGRRFLDGYANDEAQYQALMNNGLTTAQALQLTPGIALTPEQAAQLTSDIVWLVQKTVTLADGSTQQVLVPQVYVRVQDGDLLPSGALIAGDSIDLDLTGDLTNAGTIAGRSIVSLTADNIRNLGGRISGTDTALSARTDLNNIGGLIQGGDSLTLTAGRDINIASTTSTQSSSQGSRTNINRVAGLYVSNPNAVLVASAGRDVNLMAASIVNSGTDGTTVLNAGNNLNLGTVTEASSQANARNGKNYLRTSESSEIGTNIQTSGDITLQSGNDINARAATVTSTDGAIKATAADDITLTTGQSTQTLSEGHRTKSHGFLSSKTKTTRNSLNDTEQEATSFSGDTVTLTAGNSQNAQGNININGSNVVSTHGTDLNATGDVNITAATNTLDSTAYKKTSKSGVFSSGGVGVTIGSQKLSNNNDTTETTAVASTVGSTAGDVNINAGKAYTQTGSDVLAPQGDINIAAQQVDIQAAQNTSRSVQTTKFSQSGLSISISNPVISAVQTGMQMTQAASQTSDPRMQALAAATTALAVNNAATAVANGQAGGIDISVSIGSSKSKSSSTQTSTTAASSQIVAGGDVSITATGAGNNSDINVIGSSIKSGNDVTFQADDQINLLAAQNTATLDSKNKSSSASVGFSVGTNGFAVTASASRGKGKANGTDITYTNTEVSAGNNTGNTLTLESGTDTTLRGATASGNQVVADVGTSGTGNLNIQSLQDTSTYNGKQSSSGFSVSVPIGAGTAGGSISASKSKINSDYASVTEQSGIKAGDGGFQVNVNGNTNLTGAVIASTETAIQNNRNNLITETLTASDIQNKAEFAGESSSFNAGVGRHTDKNGEIKNSPSASAGIASVEDKASSITQSGVSGGAIGITDNSQQTAITGKDAATTVATLNRDVHVQQNADGTTTVVDSQGNSTAHSITPIFDQQKVERELQAGVAITQAFSQVAPKAVADFATNKASDLKTQAAQAEKAGDTARANQLKADAAKWEEGGVYRVALHTALGGLITGDISGALGAGAVASAAPLLNDLQKAVQQQLENAGLGTPTANTVSQALAELTSLGIGSVVGGTAGAATSLVVDTNNRQLHQSEINLAKQLAAKSKGKYTQEQIENALRSASNNALGESIATGMIIPISADTPSNAVYDNKGMMLISDGAGNSSLIQNPVMLATPSTDIMSFIRQNTGATYSWNLGTGVTSLPAANASPYSAGWNTGESSASLSGALPQDNRTQAQIDADQARIGNFALGSVMMATGVGIYGLPSLSMMGTGAAIGSSVNAGFQYITNPDGHINYVDATFAGITGGLTMGQTLVPSLLINTGGAMTGAAINNQNVTSSAGGAAVGTLIGYPLGFVVEQSGVSVLRTTNTPSWVPSQWSNMGVTVRETPVPIINIPEITGATTGAVMQEVVNDETKKYLEKK